MICALHGWMDARLLSFAQAEWEKGRGKGGGHTKCEEREKERKNLITEMK